MAKGLPKIQLENIFLQGMSAKAIFPRFQKNHLEEHEKITIRVESSVSIGKSETKKKEPFPIFIDIKLNASLLKTTKASDTEAINETDLSELIGDAAVEYSAKFSISNVTFSGFTKISDNIECRKSLISQIYPVASLKLKTLLDEIGFPNAKISLDFGHDT